MKKLSIQGLTLTGLLAALLAILSQVAVPLPSGVPITLQTFAVALCGFILGPRLGALSVAVYLALGAVGLPVFAGFRGGLASFVGVTGGFLWGFAPMAALCGARKPWWAVAGLALCHGLGIAQFALVASVPLLQSAVTVSTPYLLKDALSVLAAYLAARAVRKRLAAAHVSVP